MAKKAQKTGPPFTSPKTDIKPSISIAQHFRDELGRFISGNSGDNKRYTSAEDLQQRIIDYFQFCYDNKQRLTMTGLAIALGFRSRNSLVNYEKAEGYEFAFDIIQYAKMRVQEYTEQKLHDPHANVAGAIFSLKNNWGWVDKQEVKMDQRSMILQGFKMVRADDEPSGD